MKTAIPQPSDAEIRNIRDELAREGKEAPLPERVEVVVDEDFEGDPVLRLRIFYPASIPPEQLPWDLVSPLVRRLGTLVNEQNDYSLPVLADYR